MLATAGQSRVVLVMEVQLLYMLMAMLVTSGQGWMLGIKLVELLRRLVGRLATSVSVNN